MKMPSLFSKPCMRMISGVSLVGVNGSAYIHFVEEVAATPWCDNSIDILEDQKTRRHGPSLDEDIADIPGLRSCLDVQGRN